MFMSGLLFYIFERFYMDNTNRPDYGLSCLSAISEDATGQELYKKFNELKQIILEDKSPKHRLNTNTVTGIWYMADFGNEHPHILIRSPFPIGTTERLLIDHDIWEYILNENQYDYDTDLQGENEYVSGITKMLRAIVKNGNVYTVYDADKESIV